MYTVEYRELYRHIRADFDSPDDAIFLLEQYIVEPKEIAFVRENVYPLKRGDIFNFRQRFYTVRVHHRSIDM